MNVSVTFKPADGKWVGSTWHIRKGSVLLAVTTSRSRAVEEAFHAGLSRSDAERMVNQARQTKG